MLRVEAKISDFGLSRIGECYVVKRSKRIPLRWTAPESFTAFKFTAKSDVFAFAIFMWEVLSDGEEPYKHKTNIEVRRMVLTNADLNSCMKTISQLSTTFSK